MDGWVGGWIDGWWAVDRKMDGWMYSLHKITCTSHVIEEILVDVQYLQWQLIFGLTFS